MEEVKLVREMTDVDEESKKSRDANELMIETHPEGYNSGRTYYLQAESKAFCQQVVQQLNQYCKEANERANAQTAFTLAQQHSRKMYRSTIFQNIVAILIIAVCPHKSFECHVFLFFWQFNTIQHLTIARTPGRILSYASWTHNTRTMEPLNSIILLSTSTIFSH